MRGYPFLTMDQEYHVEVKELRAEFAAVDPNNPASLRAWFQAYPYLTTNDLCQIAQVCPRTVQRWRRRAGLPGLRRKPPRACSLHRMSLMAPIDWRAGTWLQNQYQIYSIRTIARAVGRSYRAIQRELRRRGVVFRSPREAVRSPHPCRTRAWLVSHYIEKGLSLHRCARLAGVSTSTMTGWLLQFEIRIRTISEQQWWSGQRQREDTHRAGP